MTLISPFKHLIWKPFKPYLQFPNCNTVDTLTKFKRISNLNLILFGKDNFVYYLLFNADLFLNLIYTKNNFNLLFGQK